LTGIGIEDAGIKTLAFSISFSISSQQMGLHILLGPVK